LANERGGEVSIEDMFKAPQDEKDFDELDKDGSFDSGKRISPKFSDKGEKGDIIAIECKS
jgi:hypothetical protein